MAEGHHSSLISSQGVEDMALTQVMGCTVLQVEARSLSRGRDYCERNEWGRRPGCEGTRIPVCSPWVVSPAAPRQHKNGAGPPPETLLAMATGYWLLATGLVMLNSLCISGMKPE